MEDIRVMTYTAFTLCSNNYLSQAIVLGQSLLRATPKWRYVIGLVDKRDITIDYDKIGFDIVDVDQVGIADLEDMVHRYSVIELDTAVKPYYFKYLFLSRNTEDVVVYLDPDIYVYKPLLELEFVMQKHDIALIPHCQSAMPLDGCIPTEEDILNTGIYNLGFLAVKKTMNGLNMIHWWADRLMIKAYVNFEKGLFTDQIWQNLVPIYYPNTYIFTHRGYDVAYWNLHERSIDKQGEDWMVSYNANLVPLVFFHFSGFNPEKPMILSKYQNRITLTENDTLFQLFEEYAKSLIENKYSEYRKYICYYQKMHTEYESNARKKQLQKLTFFQRYRRVSLLYFRGLMNNWLSKIDGLMSQK